MPATAEELLPTRATLLARLQNWHDQASWQQFFDTYWKLIYGVARQSGLTEAEAQDVVQETMLAAAKHLPDFKYNPAIGSFKTWLLNMTRWRIADQLRKRVPAAGPKGGVSMGGSTTATELLERIADPAIRPIEEVWEMEWQENLLQAALANVRHRLDPRKFQIFDLYVNKDWPAEKLASTFGLSTNQVYLAKHRVTELIRDEVSRLEREMT